MPQERRPFRFVHTADLHLDSPLELRDDSVIGRLGGATRQALTRLVDLCIDEAVDALVIAGDLFDGDVRTAETVARLTLEMRRLRDARIRVFIIYGNHDRKSGNEKALEFPDNVHVFDGRGKPCDLPEQDVCIHGVSFTRAHIAESLLPKYREPRAGVWNIGLMHTSIDGSEGHDDYAPCALSALIDHGYDYWALGHIHRRRVHHDKPAVVMPGIPQGRHVNEAGACSVTLVSLTEGSAPHLEERHVRVATFDTLDMDISNASDRSDVLDIIEAALTKRVTVHDGSMLLLRLRLFGETPAAFSLLDAPELLTTEVDGLVQRYDELAIEKIRLNIDLPGGARHTEDALPLDDLFSDAVLGDASVENMIEEEFERLKRDLPGSFKQLLGDSPEARESLKRTLLAQGVLRVKARLGAERHDEN